MVNIRRVSDKVSVGGQPGAEELRRLRAQGFTAVVNLRVEGEAEGMPGIREEGDQAADLGLAYRHVPISLASLVPAQVAAVRAAIEEAAGPVYVHCGAGQRACALALLATAHDPADLHRAAADLGLPITDSRLDRFVREQMGEPSIRLLQAV